jgi:cell division septum initiation protein DivIVA
MRYADTSPWPDFVTERDWDMVEGGKCCEEISAYVDRVVARLEAAEADVARLREALGNLLQQIAGCDVRSTTVIDAARAALAKEDA